MSSTARRLATFAESYAEIAALPDGVTGEILAPGQVRAMSRPGAAHTRAAWKIRRALADDDLLDGGSGWWFEVEREIRFEDRLLVPDLAGWRVEAEPEFVDANPIEVVPDWVCEILSRTTQRGDRAFKLPVYAREGVGHVWVVDPEVRTVEVYASVDGRPVLVTAASGDERVVLAPFGREVEVGRWWRG